MMSEEQIISEIKGLVINKKRFYGFSIAVHEHEEDPVGLLDSYTFLDLEETISRLFDLSIKGYDIDHVSVQSARPWSKGRSIIVIGDHTIRFILVKNQEMKTNITTNVIDALTERMNEFEIKGACL